MAIGVQPIYPAEIPGALPAAFTTGNSALDGTGTITVLATAGTKGARLDRIFLKASGANAVAGMIRVFVRTSGAGTWRLIGEVQVPVTTPGANAPSFEAVWTPGGGAGMLLAGGAQVGVSTEKNDTFNALPYIGDY